MRCVRASLLLWSVSCWTVRASRATPRHAWLSSTTSRDGTILTGVIRLSAIMLLSLMKGGYLRRLNNSIPRLSAKAGQLQLRRPAARRHLDEQAPSALATGQTGRAEGDGPVAD